MAQNVAIIDYGSGNLRSVEKALERAAREAGVDANIDVTDDAALIRRADRIVLPGVGAFRACMEGLRARPGVLEALEHVVLVEGRPFLGVCVGMQLLADRGREFGGHDGLGWIAGEVDLLPCPLPGDDPAFRVPHMGWNEVALRKPHPLFENIEDEAFYFAHSFRFVPENDANMIGVCHHGVRLAAAVGRDNIFGVQFHPEKSQTAGIALLKNFLQWSPA